MSYIAKSDLTAFCSENDQRPTVIKALFYCVLAYPRAVASAHFARFPHFSSGHFIWGEVGDPECSGALQEI